MAKIKINIPKESDGHKEWQDKVNLIEQVSPEERTDEQWDELAKLNETEPEYGEGNRVYYVPTFDAAPASTLQRLPKHLFDKNGKLGIDMAMEFTSSYLSLFMPKGEVEKLTISQINEIGAMLNPSGER